MSLTSRSHKRRHEKVHENEHQCFSCRQVYARRGDLDIHNERHHGNEKQDTIIQLRRELEELKREKKVEQEARQRGFENLRREKRVDQGERLRESEKCRREKRIEQEERRRGLESLKKAEKEERQERETEETLVIRVSEEEEKEFPFIDEKGDGDAVEINEKGHPTKGGKGIRMDNPPSPYKLNTLSRDESLGYELDARVYRVHCIQRYDEEGRIYWEKEYFLK